MGGIAAPEPIAERGESIRQIPRAKIFPSPLQPRKTFRPEELQEMVDSIRERGIIQPLIVRANGDRFELIAGERRWRAAAEAKLETLPAIVRTATDREVLELALIENLQRADLSPIEEAEAYARLLKEFSLTQEEVAKQVGKARAVVANAVRLLTLPPPIRAWVASGDLSVGHAKVLLGLPNDAERTLVAERIRKDHLTVRATENLIATMAAGSRRSKPGKARGAQVDTDAVVADLEKRIQRAMGTRVRIVGKAGAGKIEIHYFTAQDLDRILHVLRVTT
jgi:ParB family chromosome partitioning protein